MKPRTKKLISISILLILVALLIYYVNENKEAFSTLTLANLWLLTHDGIETKEKAEYLNSINKIPNGI